MGEEQLTIAELMESISADELTLKKSLELFERVYMPSRNLADLTRKEYRLDIRQLIGFVEKLKITKANDVKLAHLQAFLAELEDRGLDAATRRRKCSTTKVFFGFLKDSSFIPGNPAIRLIPPRRPHKPPRRLKPGEVQALVKASAGHPRDAAIIQLLVQTGIGLSEIVGLTVDDVILATEGRGGITVNRKPKEEFLPIDDKASRALKTWLSIRPGVAAPALFVSRLQKPMKTRGFQRVVEKYTKVSGIKASPRTLRQTFEAHRKN
jgi:site-specific recombinase XerD